MTLVWITAMILILIAATIQTILVYCDWRNITKIGKHLEKQTGLAELRKELILEAVQITNLYHHIFIGGGDKDLRHSLTVRVQQWKADFDAWTSAQTVLDLEYARLEKTKNSKKETT